MTKFAIVATIQAAPGKRDEYAQHVKAHGKRCLATEPGTLQFDILLPQDDADTLMLYELYVSREAFDSHWNGASLQQLMRDTEGLYLGMTPVFCNTLA